MNTPTPDANAPHPRRKRGVAILLLLMFAFVIFMLVAASLEAHYYLHRQNRHAQQELQDRANQLRVVPDRP